jgi:hypothetical protein
MLIAGEISRSFSDIRPFRAVKGSPLCQISSKKFGQIIRKVTLLPVIWEIILRDSLVKKAGASIASWRI